MATAQATRPSTATITVREVTDKHELRQFVDFPNKLYKDIPYFVPAMYGDDLEDWDKKKNPAFEYCESRCWTAWRDGEMVGRIGAILSHKSNKTWNTNRMRFTQVDFIDDPAVSEALFATVEAWAAEKGCTQVHGPLGWCDMDREGMLVEGFDQRSMFITYYNHPYYNDHLTRLGYRKDTDWIEYKLHAPDPNSDLAKKLHRIAEHVKRSRKLKVVRVRTRLDYIPIIPKAFELINKAYAPLYSAVELTDQQVKKYSNKFLPLLSPKTTCFVKDEQGEMVALGVCAPSMAAAMQRSRGRFLPFGWVGVLKALMKNDTVDLFLIAVRPDLQGAGLNAIILDEMMRGARKMGIRYAETGPMLETNEKILAQWKLFDKEQHKRRRCYIKDVAK